MGRKSEKSPRERREAVLRLLRREAPAQKIARDLEVSENTLYRWRDEFLAGGEQALAAKGPKANQHNELERYEKKLAERDQVIGELTIANRILKKLSDGRL
ncbi:MAG: helix-turn-helix domain-containing protein [Phycisphaerales bacterium]|nr:helix-turn-helix domain-containing protein [Phycisphaerales bacterium]